MLWPVDFPLDDVLEELAYSGRDFSDVVDTAFESIPDSAIALITDGQHVTHVAIAERGPGVATRKRRVTFRRIEAVGPIALVAITNKLPPRAQQVFATAVADGRARIPAGTWKACRAAIAAIDPECAAVIASLAPQSSLRHTKARRLQWEERDAVLLGLELSGIKRPWMTLPRSPGAHFLDALSRAEVSEDRLIEHDASRFPGWIPTSERPAVSKTFGDGTGRTVTVINVNRDPIELTTGVDLIYYREDTDSFVLVQYKRLRNEPPNWVFRPAGDASWKKEVGRMEMVLAASGRPQRLIPRDYFLEQSPFFIKLCRPTTINRSSRDLASGLYLSLDYWKVLESAPESRGPRGGVAIGYHNAQKWLTSTLFIELIKRDWLGSSEGTSALLRGHLTRSIDAGRSTVIAVAQPPQSPRVPVVPATLDWFDDVPF